MNEKTYIIDGYNLIHKSTKLREIFFKNSQLARETLVSLLSEFFSKNKGKCILVFDGGTNLQNTLSTPKVRVLFSTPPHKADDEIKKIILSKDIRDRSNFIVVSSDNEIINCVKACGAKRISSEEFLQTLNAQGQKLRDQDEKPFVKLTPEEIKRMLER